MCNYRLQLQYGNETIMTHDSHARHNLERLLSRPACHGAAWSGDEYSVCNPPHPLFDEDACKARYPEAFALTYWSHTWWAPRFPRQCLYLAFSWHHLSQPLERPQ